MRINEKKYRQIYQKPSYMFGDAEWRRRGFTIVRKKCGCSTMTREVVGFSQTTITEYCRKHSTNRQVVPLTIKLDA